ARCRRIRLCRRARPGPPTASLSRAGIRASGSRLCGRSRLMERIVLPTPFPVGPVNVWLLRGDPLTLVDAGPHTPEALATLERGLGELGVRLEDIEQLVLTHQHPDHVGLAATVVERSGCPVAAHELLAGYVRDTQAAMAAEEAWQDTLLR